MHYVPKDFRPEEMLLFLNIFRKAIVATEITSALVQIRYPFTI